MSISDKIMWIQVFTQLLLYSREIHLRFIRKAIHTISRG